MNLPPKALARFWSKIAEPDENGCRMWTAGTSGSGGFGVFKVYGVGFFSARRLAYELQRGPLRPDQRVSLSCKRAACCEVEHMILREPGQRRSATAKLSEDDVRAIRRAVAAGERSSALARRFRVHPRTILSVRRGVNWAWVT